MSLDPNFLDLDDVFVIHDQQIQKYGGSLGVRGRGLLESAIAQPQSGFGGQYLHKGLFEMAAAYAFHIAENQPFIDGNKRTALACALVFLDLNGANLKDSKGQLYSAMIDLAEKKLDKAGLARLLEALSK